MSSSLADVVEYSLSSLAVDVIHVGVAAQHGSGRALLGGMIAFVISIYHHPHESKKLGITVECVPARSTCATGLSPNMTVKT
jgi:hypothetical protein